LFPGGKSLRNGISLSLSLSFTRELNESLVPARAKEQKRKGQTKPKKKARNKKEEPRFWFFYRLLPPSRVSVFALSLYSFETKSEMSAVFTFRVTI
jgi:hypothetical protein